MKSYQGIWAVGLVGCLMVLGCGGASPKKEGSSPQRDLVADPIFTNFDDDNSVSDHSTGDAVPTGPGVDAPEKHIMSANAASVYNDGVRAGKSGDLDLAQQSFRRAVEMDPLAYQAIYNLGVVEERKGNEEKAKGLYRKSLAVQPDYSPALDAMVKLLIRQNKVDEAVGLMQSRSSNYPKNIEVLTSYAEALIAANRYSDAIDVAKQALRLDERSARAMLKIGKANFLLGRFELAQSIYDQVLAITPDDPEVPFLKGLIALEEDDRSGAILLFEDALEKNPQYVEALNNLAIQFILSGNYESAAQKLNLAISISPSWAVLYLNYGNALRGMGKWIEARTELKRAYQMDSSLIGSLFNLGVLYFVATEIDNLDRLSRLNEAKAYFARYKSEMGVRLQKDDLVHKYLKETSVALEREQRRIEQMQEQAKREAQRATERDAAGDDSTSSGQSDQDDDEWEDDEGWE